MIKMSLLGAAAAMAVVLAADAANAAPAPIGALSRAETAAVQPVALTCWWHKGKRHCKYYSYNSRRYRVYGRPEAYRTGSGYWWEEMDRDQRGGRR